jgi:hypothetical protein
VKDERPDELLEACGRTAHRLHLKLGWSDGLSGLAAKRCSRSGQAAWKNAQPLPAEGQAAAAFFARRCRTRNPVVPAAANGLVIVECDLDVPGDAYPRLRETELRVAEILLGLGVHIPLTVVVRSRRGFHFYSYPASGCSPAKIQVDGRGAVTYSEDGYVVGVPGLHELEGVVYEYVHDGEITTLPAEEHERLVQLGEAMKVERRQRLLEDDGPIPRGSRTETLKLFCLRLIRDGTSARRVLEEALTFNRSRCRPPLDERLVVRNVNGLTRWAAKHPTEAEKARAEARQILKGQRSGAGADAKPPATAGKRKRALLRRRLSSVESEPVEYLIEKHVPVGAQTLNAGIGGLGKTALLLAWSKQITDSGRDVLIISYEDQSAQVIRPRFEALGGDLDRLHELYVDPLDGTISFPTDLPELDRHVRETKAAAVLIDPVSASIDLKLDAHRDQDVRVVLGQLAKLAERERIAVLLNAHLNKQPSSDPYLRINGSTAFYNAARSVLTVTPDPVDPDWHRLVAHHKSNYGQLADVERWRVVPVTVETKRGPIETMVMEFVEVADDVSREGVLTLRPITQDKLDEAVAFLEGALVDGDWHDSAGLVKLAHACGISERTLRRAALEGLQVEHERRGFPSSTWWRLPSHASPSPTDLA